VSNNHNFLLILGKNPHSIEENVALRKQTLRKCLNMKQKITGNYGKGCSTRILINANCSISASKGCQTSFHDVKVVQSVDFFR